MNKELNKVKLRLLASLCKLNYSYLEEELFSLEFPDDPKLRKLKLITVVDYLEERFRDPKKFLQAGLKDESYEVKKIALSLILNLNDDRLIGDIVPLLDEENEIIADMASETICKLCSEEKDLLKPLIDIIVNKKIPLKARIRGLKALKYKNDMTLILDTLASVLTDENLEIRKEASKAVKYIEDHDIILNTLLEILYSDRDLEIELSVIWAISNIESPKIVEYIKPYLKHEDKRFQEAAIYGLGNSKDKNMIESLVEKFGYIKKQLNAKT